MGGIKNKQSKLSNKVKNLLTNIQFLPLDRRNASGTASRRTPASRVLDDRQTTKLSGGLTILLSDYRLTSPFSQRGTKSSLPLAKGRQMSVAHRWGRIAKYTSLACLTLAILSTLVLNIISSYSHSSINTNAVDGSSNANNASTLADSNTTSISLSFTNLSTGSNDPSISLTIPRGGGIATGGHTVTVQTNASRGYNVTLLADSSRLSSDASDFAFNSASGTLASPQPLGNNQWGIAIPGRNGFNSDVSDYQSAGSQILQTTKWAAVPTSGYVNDRIIMKSSSATSDAGDSQVVMYGANCVGFVLAGSYSTNVTYTATAFIQAAPSLDRFDTGNDTTYAGKTDQFILHGSNLNNIQSLWIDYNDNGVHDDNETTAIDDTATDKGQVTFTNAPSDHIGIHDVYIETLGGVDRLERSFIIQPASICRSGDPNNDCQVDIDDNMIPIKYDDTNSTLTNPIWTSIAVSDDSSNPGDWYDYSQQKWANAVTVKPEALDKYKGKTTKIDEEDVLGYWVYIPRYSYEVSRRDAADKVSSDYNFIIEFETAADAKKYPAASCSAPAWNYIDQNWYVHLLGVKNYRTECGIERIYSKDTDNDNNTTTWSTHPAFTVGNKELNGVWVGKFSSVASVSNNGIAMVVKPSIFVPLDYQSYYGMGPTSPADMLNASKLVGQTDPDNAAGNAEVPLAENSNNLQSYTSHVVNNNEWGTILYLTFSTYGVGDTTTDISGNASVVSPDNDQAAGLGGYVTGCGSDNENPYLDYDDATISGVSDNMLTASCSASNPEAQYNGTDGVLASTTNNVYGIYDLTGVRGNLVAALMIDDRASGSHDDIQQLLGGKLANVCHYGSEGSTFGVKPVWWGDDSYAESYWHDYSSQAFYDTCTYELCGGQALHEVVVDQVISDGGLGGQHIFPDGYWAAGGLYFPVGIRGVDSEDSSSIYTGVGEYIPWDEFYQWYYMDILVQVGDRSVVNLYSSPPRIVLKPE